MPDLLLINPRKRRAGGTAKKRRSTRRRRRNPINNIRSAVANRRAGRVMNPRRRRRNPLAFYTRRRRRNPISLGGTARTLMSQVKDALIGAGGAVAIDLAFAKAAGFLPATLQPVKGTVGAGDAVKAIFTVALGKLLAKPTRGLSTKMAMGALTVQAHGIVSAMLPASMQVNGLAYYSPARIADMTNRVGPVRRGMNAYTPAGQTQLLNAYTQKGRTQLLNASPRVREGMTIR